MVKKHDRGFAHVALLVLILLLLAGVIAYLLVVKGLASNPFSAFQKTKVALQSQYQNPFDKSTQYTNPFSQYKNPFDVAK